MRILFIVLFTSSITFAQTPELCDENGNPISGILGQIAIPNCLTPDNVESAVKKNDQSKICGECRSQYQLSANRNLDSLSAKSKKENFIKAALNEYKKSITDNLVETLKLRTLQPTGADFRKSIVSCKMKSLDEISKGCSAETKGIIANSGILNNLNKQISNELGKLISQDSTYSPEPTLLKRDSPSCFISEKDLLLITSRAAEEALSPSVINALINLNPDDFGDIGHMFIDESISEIYDGDFSELAQSLKSHPLLAEHVKSPKDFVTFLQSIPSPRNLENLRSALYSKTSGEKFDQKLANNCEKSFEVINKALCSNDFDSGRFNLDAFSNHKKIFEKEVPSNPESLAATEEILNSNYEMFKLCDNNAGNNKLGLLSTTQSLNENLRSSYQDLTIDEFRELKFKTEIGNLNTYVCTNSSRPCKEDTFECKILQKYNDLKNSGSLESKLARSSNTEVNKLLRSMIGDTRNIEPKTKEILIASGIIPQDDGTLVEQPDIPERRPEFYAQNSNQNSGLVKPNVVQSIPNQNTRNVPVRSQASSNENYSNVPSAEGSANQESLADFSDILNDSSEDLQRMQDEIRRRLMDLPPEVQRNQAKVKKVVKDSSRKLGRNLTPQEINAVANRIVNTAPASSVEDSFEAPASSTGEAQVSDTQTQLEKWRSGQRDEALMGMAGAQQASNGRGPAAASTEAPKDLTKIALNIPEDPQVRLSEVFYNKLNMNDSETQLLKVLMKNKSNFLLQVNSLNFRINFSNNSFNLLLENGDEEAAERIRPQLEIFLRRLNS